MNVALIAALISAASLVLAAGAVVYSYGLNKGKIKELEERLMSYDELKIKVAKLEINVEWICKYITNKDN